jgi:hypothetical protein
MTATLAISAMPPLNDYTISWLTTSTIRWNFYINKFQLKANHSGGSSKLDLTSLFMIKFCLNPSLILWGYT